MTGPLPTSSDAFLGGRLTLEQPVRGYRAGVDPVLLASAVPAKPGDTVLELGCGAGAALLCLGARVAGLSLHGVEVQPAYAELCRRNAVRNALPATIWTADIRALPPRLGALTFHQVIANPPYFEAEHGKSSTLPHRDMALRGDSTVFDWIEIATRRLKPKGWLTLIHKADRLPEILRAMDGRLGDLSVYPITGRAGRPADRVLIRARKGARGPFRLHAPTHLHAGATHHDDRPDYSSEIASVLRNGAPFPLPD